MRQDFSDESPTTKKTTMSIRLPNTTSADKKQHVNLYKITPENSVSQSLLNPMHKQDFSLAQP